MRTLQYVPRYFPVILLLFLTSVTSLASSPANQERSFDLFIVPTVDEQLDSWLKVPPQLNPTIHMVETVYPNQPFALRLLFRNYARSDNRNVHITYDVQFFGPDSEPTADRGNNLLAYRGSVANPDAIIVNQQFLRIFFDESYPPGEYRIRVLATDHVAGQQASVSGTLTLAPFEKSGHFVSFDFFNYWLRHYFRQPDVAKAVFGILQYLEPNPDWLAENPALVAYTRRLLRDNPWLGPHLAELSRTGISSEEKILTLQALGRYRMPEEPYKTLGPEQEAWLNHVEGLEGAGAGKPLSTPEDIAAAWGEFYATGHLDPVREIVSLLEPFALSDPSDAVRKQSVPEQAAFWSLVENGREVPLVTKYATYLLEHDALTPQNKIQLRLALQIIEKSLEEEPAESPGKGKKIPLSQVR